MVKCKYFFGNKISDYGLKNGYVDYGTLAKAFDAVLNNDIVKNTIDIGFWEQINGLGKKTTHRRYSNIILSLMMAQKFFKNIQAKLFFIMIY